MRFAILIGISSINTFGITICKACEEKATLLKHGYSPYEDVPTTITIWLQILIP